MPVFPIKNLLVEGADNGLNVPLRHLKDWLKDNPGEDIVRMLHAKDIEIVSHTTGALIKAYRTGADYDDGPEECWRFFAGWYEIDPHEIETKKGDVVKRNNFPGFTHRDYYVPILYIMQRHKENRLRHIAKHTLLIIQTTAYELPGVRAHKKHPKGRMIVAGVKYKVDPEFVKKLLRTTRMADLQSKVQQSDKWESYDEVKRMAAIFDTDSVPLFFRGKLSDIEGVIKGIKTSASDDTLFSRVLKQFFDEGGTLTSKEDYDRFFRRILSELGDFEIRELDDQAKVERRIPVTRETYEDVIKRVYGRYEDVVLALAETISKHGKESEQHKIDFKSLHYLDRWISRFCTQEIFPKVGWDSITRAISEIDRAGERKSEGRILNWVRRDIEEGGAKNKAYREHMKDGFVPDGRHTSKNSLWDKCSQEINRLVRERLTDVLSDIKQTDKEEPVQTEA